MSFNVFIGLLSTKCTESMSVHRISFGDSNIKIVIENLTKTANYS